MQEGKPDPTARKMRQALRIDTWGLDIYRMKRRIGEMVLQIETLQNEVQALREHSESEAILNNPRPTL